MMLNQVLYSEEIFIKIKNFFSRGKYLETNLNASIAALAHGGLRLEMKTYLPVQKSYQSGYSLVRTSWAHNKREFLIQQIKAFQHYNKIIYVRTKFS